MKEGMDTGNYLHCFQVFIPAKTYFLFSNYVVIITFVYLLTLQLDGRPLQIFGVMSFMLTVFAVLGLLIGEAKDSTAVESKRHQVYIVNIAIAYIMIGLYFFIIFTFIYQFNKVNIFDENYIIIVSTVCGYLWYSGFAIPLAYASKKAKELHKEGSVKHDKFFLQVLLVHTLAFYYVPLGFIDFGRMIIRFFSKRMRNMNTRDSSKLPGHVHKENV